MLYRDEGVVLRTYKLGEADRIVVLCTRGRGKVRAVAKGVRKTKSKFGSRLEPTSHVALQLYEGRELDIVTQVESIDHFRAIRDDLDRIAKASSMLEVVDQTMQEGGPNPRLYQMLLGGLRSLAEQNGALVVPAFFWKLLAARGLRPDPRPVRRVRDDRVAGGLRPRHGRRAVRRPPAGRGHLARGARPAAPHPRRPARRRAQRATVGRHPRGRAPGHPVGRAPPRTPPEVDVGPGPGLADRSPLLGGLVELHPALTDRIPLDVGVAGRVPLGLGRIDRCRGRRGVGGGEAAGGGAGAAPGNPPWPGCSGVGGRRVRSGRLAARRAAARRAGRRAAARRAGRTAGRRGSRRRRARSRRARRSAGRRRTGGRRSSWPPCRPPAGGPWS